MGFGAVALVKMTNKVAFVFPGQGSQAVGMLASFLAEGSPHRGAVSAVIERASSVLKQDLARLLAEGPAEELNLTVNTQPAMLVAGYAVFAAWQAAGGARPALMAGHSLGEYTALTAAGALSLDDGVQLVRFRANAMQEAVPVGTGGMAAILGLADDQVRAACEEAAQGEVVEAVNFNAPSQVVIAGHKAAVERACEAAKSRGAKRAVLLPVSAPFHSSLLRPASERLRGRLAEVQFAAPQVPVINNVDVAAESDPARIRDALARQAAGPVRWVETIGAMAAQGVTHVVEIGPGRVLAGLTKRIASGVESLAVVDPASLADALGKLRA
jgi:[acyl-carrier-protein] S-malonyltransferase